MPSAPAVPQQILRGDTGGTGQCFWGLVPTPQPGVVLVPEPQPGELGARQEQRQQAQVGQGMGITSLPAPPCPQQWGQS